MSCGFYAGSFSSRNLEPVTGSLATLYVFSFTGGGGGKLRLVTIATTWEPLLRVSAATREAVHQQQQGNQELHVKQEEAMILAVLSFYIYISCFRVVAMVFQGLHASRARLCCSQQQCRC